LCPQIYSHPHRYSIKHHNTHQNPLHNHTQTQDTSPRDTCYPPRRRKSHKKITHNSTNNNSPISPLTDPPSPTNTPPPRHHTRTPPPNNKPDVSTILARIFTVSTTTYTHIAFTPPTHRPHTSFDFISRAPVASTRRPAVGRSVGRSLGRSRERRVRPTRPTESSRESTTRGAREVRRARPRVRVFLVLAFSRARVDGGGVTPSTGVDSEEMSRVARRSRPRRGDGCGNDIRMTNDARRASRRSRRRVDRRRCRGWIFFHPFTSSRRRSRRSRRRHDATTRPRGRSLYAPTRSIPSASPSAGPRDEDDDATTARGATRDARARAHGWKKVCPRVRRASVASSSRARRRRGGTIDDAPRFRHHDEAVVTREGNDRFFERVC